MRQPEGPHGMYHGKDEPMLDFLLQLHEGYLNENLFVDAYQRLQPFDLHEYASSVTRFLKATTNNGPHENQIADSIKGTHKKVFVDALKESYSTITGHDPQTVKTSQLLTTLEQQGLPSLRLFHGTALAVTLLTNTGQEIVAANPLFQRDVYVTQWYGEAAARFNPFGDRLPYILAFPLGAIYQAIEENPHLANVQDHTVNGLLQPTVRFSFGGLSSHQLDGVLRETGVFASPRAR